jgi:hypothetical protein
MCQHRMNRLKSLDYLELVKSTLKHLNLRRIVDENLLLNVNSNGSSHRADREGIVEELFSFIDNLIVINAQHDSLTEGNESTSAIASSSTAKKSSGLHSPGGKSANGAKTTPAPASKKSGDKNTHEEEDNSADDDDKPVSDGYCIELQHSSNKTNKMKFTCVLEWNPQTYGLSSIYSISYNNETISNDKKNKKKRFDILSEKIGLSSSVPSAGDILSDIITELFDVFQYQYGNIHWKNF